MSTYFVLLSYVLGIYVLQHDINSSKTTTVKVQNTTRVQGISNKKLLFLTNDCVLSQNLSYIVQSMFCIMRRFAVLTISDMPANIQ